MIGDDFVECLSIRIWLILCNDQVEVMNSGYEYYRSVLYPQYHTGGYWMLIWLITGDVNLDHLIKIVFSVFFHCKLTNFPIIINSTFRLCKYFLLFVFSVPFPYHWKARKQYFSKLILSLDKSLETVIFKFSPISIGSLLFSMCVFFLKKKGWWKIEYSLQFNQIMWKKIGGQWEQELL